jgi:hypothetical protein
MSADYEAAAELRRHYRAGKRALDIVETCTPVPREPRDRTELFNALRTLGSLVEGYNSGE